MATKKATSKKRASVKRSPVQTVNDWLKANLAERDKAYESLKAGKAYRATKLIVSKDGKRVINTVTQQITTLRQAIHFFNVRLPHRPLIADLAK